MPHGGSKKSGGKKTPGKAPKVSKGKVGKGGKNKAIGTRKSLARAAKPVRVVSKPVLACQVKKLIKARKDRALLQAHLEAINLHEQKYVARLKQAEAKKAKGDASEQHAIPAHKAKITEAKGEYEATLLMISNYVKSKGAVADFQILWTFTAGTGIDQLWWTGDPPDHYVLVEAKGPGATLSTNAAKGDQMSSMWVRNSLEAVKNSPSAGPSEINHAKRMLKAMDVGPPPYIYGRVIEALPSGGAKEVTCPDKGIYHKTK